MDEQLRAPLKKEKITEDLLSLNPSAWAANSTHIEIKDQKGEVQQENDSRPRVLQCPALLCEVNHIF